MTCAMPLGRYRLAVAATAVLAGCSDNQCVLAPKGPGAVELASLRLRNRRAFARRPLRRPGDAWFSESRAMLNLVAVLSGPIVWALHFFSLYLIEALACTVVGTSAGTRVRTNGAVITALALAVLLGLAVRHRRGFRRRSHGTANSADALERCAALLAVLSLVAVLWAYVPLFVFPACVPGGT
jgi:hypothetical protein